MPGYRRYCKALASDGNLSRITRVTEIKAADDAKAIARAKELNEDVVCELWHLDRLVATIPAHRA
jgi:hypothetical protein